MSRRLKILFIFGLIALFAIAFVYFWNAREGKIFLSAQTEQCQNDSQLSMVYGGSQWAVGSELVPINFMGQEILFNRIAAPWLKKAVKKIKKSKTRYNFSNIQTFNWRVKTAGYGQSLHSYGIAIDINPQQNPYTYSGQLITDIPRGVINIFKENGFFWGGDWKGFKDPMHFEWYGAEISGKLIDRYSRDLVDGVNVYVDNDLISRVSGNYSFAVPEGRHLITLKNPRYKDYRFRVKVACNQVFVKNITLQPIPLGTPGKIVGKVILPPQSPLELPADIYVDGVYATKTDVSGYYEVADIPGGLVHLVEAKIIPIFVGSTKVKVIPGKVSKDVNINVVPGTNR